MWNRLRPVLVCLMWLCVWGSWHAALAEPRTPAEMTARVDELLRARWEAEGVQPVRPADDYEFLRRVYLDLTGVIPSVAEVREFVADPAPDKRTRIVRSLLRSPAHASHLATTWRRILLPRGFEPEQLDSAIGLEDWLRRQFLENLRYDNLVADFLVAQGDGSAGPALYYTSLEVKPEKLAASTASIFLGVQIQCAECHDHPFDRWTQRDFWGYAAFFAQLEKPGEVVNASFRLADLDRGEVMLPGQDEVVPPRFPGGDLAPQDDIGSRRSRLAIWLASRDNPYLARAAVNWVWAELFGRGLVHPMDDHGLHNPPSHPELLEELAEFFVDQGFDLRIMFEVLAGSAAYQLSSDVGGSSPPPELFARRLPKTLHAEQFYDCLLRASRAPPNLELAGGMAANRLRDPQRMAFVARMQNGSSRDATEYESGLPQALMMMNGPFLTEAADPQRSGLLQALGAPFLTHEDQIETVYLAALARHPTPEERAACLEHLQAAGAESAAALGDVLWTLLNSAEFCLNH